MDKLYTFVGPDRTVGLLDLFEGRSQLVMHHFMFGPGMGREARRVPRADGLDDSSTTAAGTSTSPPSARQEVWEEPKGRAVPLGLHVGGPAVCLPDQYDT